MIAPPVGLVGLPWDVFSSFRRGCAQAPALIRKVLLSDAGNLWCEAGFSLADGWQDHGDVPQNGDFMADIGAAINRVHQLGQRPLSLGGDHAVTYPILAALAQHTPPPTLVQFDAHADLYDNFEDQPFSHASPFARIMEQGLAKRLIQIGIRTLNGHQREQATRFGVEVIGMHDLDRAMNLTISGPVYVSLDLDGLDPACAPGVSHPEPGGLNTRQVLNILHRMGGNLIGADVVEYNPTRDIHDLTACVAAKFTKELAARMVQDAEKTA